jgi:type IV pilus assembly protein PilA
MRKRFWKGLRTIDLAIVLTVIGITLGVVANRYDEFKCRAMQSEAKFSLQEIYAAQALYHSQHDCYATLDQLTIEDRRVILPQKYYIFSDQKAPSAVSFAISAKGLDGSLVAGELWSVNEFNDIQMSQIACKTKGKEN